MKFKKSLIIVAAISLVLIIGALVYKFVIMPGQNAPPSASALQSWQVPLDLITTNLQGGSMIQVQFTLQAPNANVANQLGSLSAEVDDAVIGVLHGLSSGDIMQVNGDTMLKQLIAQKVDGLLGNSKISTVYIDKLIVQ